MNLAFNMSLKIGTFKQKANPMLVYFVFSCIVITVGLLFIMQKAVAKGETLVPPASAYL